MSLYLSRDLNGGRGKERIHLTCLLDFQLTRGHCSASEMEQSTNTTPRSAIPPPNPDFKSRNGSLPFLGTVRQPSGLHTLSRLAVRTPSQSVKFALSPNSSLAKSTPAVPTLRSLSTTASTAETDPADKEVRRSITIASFPQPPGIQKRIAASPKTSSTVPHTMPENIPARSSSTNATAPPSGRSRLKRLRIAEDPPNYHHMASTASPTLRNGNGGGKSITTDYGRQDSKGLVCSHSPPISRSSSAEDSCSTSATTFEDTDDTARKGRGDTTNGLNNNGKAGLAKEGKGNVIVSVRVRPDAGGGGDKKSEGEWMVDGRRSLVAYKGREGGDYFYGESDTYIAVAGMLLTVHPRQCFRNPRQESQSLRCVRQEARPPSHGRISWYGFCIWHDWYR